MGESSPSLLSSMWFLLALPALVAGQCQVNLDKVNGKYPPLLLQNSQFIFPTEKVGEERVLNFEEADSLDLFCHGGSDEKQARIFVRRSDKSKKDSKVSLTCKSGEFFVSGSEEKIAVEKATCNQKQEPRLDRKQEQCAPVGDDGRTDKLESLQRVSIGWQIEGTFIEQIGICIDESNFGTIWTNHTVRGASIALRDIDPKRPSFRADTGAYTRKNQRFFKWSTSTKLNKLYSKTSQKSTVTALLGGITSIEDETIIETSSSGTDYFAKGHLSPDAAFVYNVLQDATYYFINVAPQFQSFNNGNWKALEMAVRDLGTKFGRDLVVTTGTHEVLEYPDKSNSPTDIYLARIESYVPAPKYYWKVVQDPETKTGAAFIGLNDPHTNVAPVELCKNRCSEMSSWVDWGIENLDAGYMYCCSVEDAAKAIKAIPDMTAPGGLIGGSSSPSTGGGDFSATGSCQAGPCQCSCAKNDQGVYTCTCPCNN